MIQCVEIHEEKQKWMLWPDMRNSSALHDICHSWYVCICIFIHSDIDSKHTSVSLKCSFYL